MYLIDCETTTLKLFPASRPPYAILSHTWAGEEEVTFQEFSSPSKGQDKAGFQKIRLTCEQARRDGLGYAWVDTCCINKESSAELGEAINSMFQWYREAFVCYAYIKDLSGDIELPIRDAAVLKGCRWFSRGWTLQELLAPNNVQFFARGRKNVGAKRDLSQLLEQVTGIPQKILRQDLTLEEASVADRMSWAAGRQTTREEDVAYCLMGLFDVNMAMIYGEGGKAFLRLQVEILKQKQDDSLFAWRASEQSASKAPYRGLFASSPSEFASDVSITPFRTSKTGSTNVIGGGRVLLSCTVYRDDGKTTLGLRCYRGTDLSHVILRPHQYNPAFEDIILERFAEKGDAPAVGDIYEDHAIRLLDLPREIRVARIHSKRFRGSVAAREIPLVFVLGEKLSFELDVDENASGVNQFKALGWNERLGVPEESRMRILVMLWVKEGLNPGSFEYFLDLGKVTAEVAEQEFADAHTPLAYEQEVAVGWATVNARGSLQEVNGKSFFNVEVGFAIREREKAEAEGERLKQEGEREKARLEEAPELARQARRRWIWKWGLRLCLLLMVITIITFAVCLLTVWSGWSLKPLGVALCFLAVLIPLFYVMDSKWRRRRRLRRQGR